MARQRKPNGLNRLLIFLSILLDEEFVRFLKEVVGV
jgi:hypothetical protein